jgi:hypothetical protein
MITSTDSKSDRDRTIPFIGSFVAFDLPEELGIQNTRRQIWKTKAMIWRIHGDWFTTRAIRGSG